MLGAGASTRLAVDYLLRLGRRRRHSRADGPDTTKPAPRQWHKHGRVGAWQLTEHRRKKGKNVIGGK
jgi:hypothetical protein